MSDNIIATPGTGMSIAADEVTDGILGTVKVQYVKLMDGTLDGTSKATVGANGLKVDGSAVTQPVSIAAAAKGQTTSANSLPIVVASDQTAIPTTAYSFCGAPTKTTFQRPNNTTPYTAGDLVSNSINVNGGGTGTTPMSFTGVTISGGTGTGVIDCVAVEKSGTGSATFRVHIFSVSPTFAATVGDNDPILTSNWDLATYVGYSDVQLIDSINGGAVGQTNNLGIQYSATSDTLYAVIETLTSYTPTAQSNHYVKIKVKRFS